MQRLYDLIRRHPSWVDGCWAVLLVVVTLLTFAGQHGQRSIPLSVIVLIGLGCVVGLRRRSPERVLLLAIVLGVAQLVLDVQVFVGDFALLVAVYTAASQGARWSSRLALVGAFLAAPLAEVRWPTRTTGTSEAIFFTGILMVPFVLAWVMGDSLRTRRAYFAHLEERAARLEREREAQAKVAVAAERARIARELHDVVAHNVSVMVVQADGAAYVLDGSPEQARTALETISATGRQALAEMRRLLGVLRTGEPREAGEYVPQPDVDQMNELIEQVRGAGLPVDFRIEGAVRQLPRGVELTAYRIVQEALTNTRKHGGPDAGASVRLVYFDDGLGLLIEDDGRGAPTALATDRGADGAGHGLIGMRERVGMVGGTLDAGPRPGGGFRISVLLPLKTT
ncbi:sensor histidine kinase [Streptomyces sp. NPDC088768]|uniref:sensor histidine kinase n=1 Tax=Streptomyces sp. NPDC088768 TaxID=3365894 RepID=UPI0037F58756